MSDEKEKRDLFKDLITLVGKSDCDTPVMLAFLDRQRLLLHLQDWKRVADGVYRKGDYVVKLGPSYDPSALISWTDERGGPHFLPYARAVPWVIGINVWTETLEKVTKMTTDEK